MDDWNEKKFTSFLSTCWSVGTIFKRDESYAQWLRNKSDCVLLRKVVVHSIVEVNRWWVEQPETRRNRKEVNRWCSITYNRLCQQWTMREWIRWIGNDKPSFLVVRNVRHWSICSNHSLATSTACNHREVMTGNFDQAKEKERGRKFKKKNSFLSSCFVSIATEEILALGRKRRVNVIFQLNENVILIVYYQSMNLRRTEADWSWLLLLSSVVESVVMQHYVSAQRLACRSVVLHLVEYLRHSTMATSVNYWLHNRADFCLGVVLKRCVVKLQRWDILNFQQPDRHHFRPTILNNQGQSSEFMSSFYYCRLTVRFHSFHRTWRCQSIVTSRI